MMTPQRRYVALGSSFAAGPGLRPRAAGSPRPSGRSASNSAHRLACRLDLDLVDASYSGATVSGMLRGNDRAGEMQMSAVTPDTALVTVTAGGNDVGYLPGLTLTSLPAPLRALPGVRTRIDTLRDASEIDRRIAALERDYAILVERLHQQAPRARIVLVDYLTILPPEGKVSDRRMRPLPTDMVAWGRRVAARLTATTRAVAETQAVTFVSAAARSRAHHAWSEEPWTRRFHLGIRGGAPYHPTVAGMQAVAELLSETLTLDSQ